MLWRRVGHVVYESTECPFNGPEGLGKNVSSSSFVSWRMKVRSLHGAQKPGPETGTPMQVVSFEGTRVTSPVELMGRGE